MSSQIEKASAIDIFSGGLLDTILENRVSGGPSSPAAAPAVVLRRDFRAAVAALSSRPGPSTAIAAIIAHVAVAVAAAAIAERLRTASSAAWLAALPACWFLIGSRFRALGNMMHECAHRILVRGRRGNAVLGHLLSFFDFTDFVDYANEHLSHHRHLGDPERDLDFAARRSLFDRLGPLGLRHFMLPLTLFHVPRYVRPVLWTRRDTRRVAGARLAFLAALVGLGVAIGGREIVLYYFIPYLTTYQIFRFWSDAADHAGLMTGATEFDRARNHAFRFAPLNWLLFPRHDQYHLVHHLFPGVATRHLPRLHAQLLTAPGYAARAHAFEDLR